MDLLKNLKLQQKLLLLAALPLIVTLVYTYLYIGERRGDQQQAQDILHLAQVSELLEIVHHLQYERGKAITLVTSPSTERLLEWQAAAAQSTSSARTLTALQQRLIDEQAHPEVLSNLSTLDVELQHLELTRSQLSQEKYPQAETINETYSQLVHKFNTVIPVLKSIISDTQSTRLVDSLANISQLKEIDGLIRAQVSSILAAGTVTEAQIRHTIMLNSKWEVYISEFLDLAPMKFQRDLSRFLEAGVGSENQQLLERITQAKAGDTITGDPELWFKSISQEIDRLRDIEISLSEALTTSANDSRDQASSSLWLTVLMTTGTLVLVVIATLLATGYLSKGFLLLNASALDFTRKGKMTPVPVSGRDELGELGEGFNSMMQQLKSISEAVEAVSKGDFSQKVKVKSDEDRLSLSINHMIDTLRNMVEQMQSDNWLKTGQNELSETIHSVLGVDDLAQSTLNYLAEYLKAPVGALYLVNDEGTAQLCASYAYTLRKNGRNQFSRGESLVGQAVRESKPMIIEQLPTDYMPVSSGLGESSPSQLVIWPLLYSGSVLGVLELGRLTPLTETETSLLNKVSEALAIALHAAQNREQLSELLEETQAQTEELQAQQDELEQANSELEEQAQQLEESQHELETQKQQLEDSNEELRNKSEELVKRNEVIEIRSQELEKARTTLETKAEELMSASRYKSEFLANMSHELRTPLNSLLLLAQMLKDNDENNLTPEQLEAIQIIHGSGRDLLNLINDILDLSKVEAGKLSIDKEPVALEDIIQQLKQQLQPQAREKSLDFNLNLASDVPVITTDPHRLLQILRNLLGNAIKFTEQGAVTLDILPDVDGGVLFKVSDTGIGVPAKLQNAIFEAFQQGDGSTRRKYSGTGLGLTISRELSNLLGGCIELSSEEGKGSVFTLRLPVEEDSKAAKEQTQQSSNVINDKFLAAISRPADTMQVQTAQQGQATSQASTQNPVAEPEEETFTGKETPLSEDTAENIVEFIPDDRHQLQADTDCLLIIEDDLVFARCLMELAHGRQFQCIIAGDGRSGIAMAKHYRPDAIALDMVLPDFDGQKVLEVLRQDQKTQSIPVHIISSLDQEDVNQRNAIGVLTKPISKESIGNAFSNIQWHLHHEDHKKVIIVEDDKATRKAIEAMLKKSNPEIRVLHAEDGRTALRLLERETPSCMILDLNLPDTDSMTLLQQVAGDEVDNPLPVVIYTGRDLSHEEYKQLRQYTNNIIIKGSLAQDRLLNEVTLFLHSVKPDWHDNDSHQQPGNNVLQSKKILIVDDDMRNTFALANLLKRHGMKVVLADNGSMALEKLSESNDIEMAIMDIMMPIMDGYEAIKRIRQRMDYKDLPIIALTAKAMPEDRDKCLQVGANDYLAKPVDSERLIAALKVWACA